MESGSIRRGFDLTVIAGGDPAVTAGAISSRLKFGILASTCLAVGLLVQTGARADSADEALARVRILEKEIAAIKQENEALRRFNQLRKENVSLKDRQPQPNLPLRAGRDPREAFAADAPVYMKAAVPAERGQLRFWTEGGAIWSGGDPIDSFFTRTTISALALIDTRQNFFPLVPKVGWEAATGFDYRFAGSPWHVSGQFRYGEGRTTETSSSATSFSISAGGGPLQTVSFADSEKVAHRETHWLADLALGRDVIGTGADAVQFKFGTRIAELRATTNSHQSASQSALGFFISADTNVSQEIKFLGAGPRFGVEGSVPMAPGWTLDYLGDVAALFGTQNFQRLTSIDNVVIIPSPGGSLAPPVVDTAQKFATVLNADIQVGVSYWMSQNMKASLSYRLDAYFNAYAGLDAKNDPKNLQQINRYTHGPRLAVSAQF
jgi:Legionella pneumophila major outer membrane protein precursor